MKAVMISIQPMWCCPIANGQKTLEVRRNKPNLKPPFKCYIYCTAGRPWLVFGDTRNDDFETGYKTISGCSRKEAESLWDVLNGKVIGEFICDDIRRFDVPYPAYQNELDKEILLMSCLTYYQLHRYAYHDDLYGWHISNLVIYEEPKSLNSFSRFGAQFLGCACLNRACKNFVESVCYDEPPECRITDCTLYRPPQSWCYVEELEEKRNE